MKQLKMYGHLAYVGLIYDKRTYKAYELDHIAEMKPDMAGARGSVRCDGKGGAADETRSGTIRVVMVGFGSWSLEMLPYVLVYHLISLKLCYVAIW